ncbi:ufm1-specific protease 2 isoform X2 [Arapaima gigas]
MVVENHIIFRVRGGLDFTCQLEKTDESYVQQSLKRAFETVRSTARSPSLVFGVRNSPIFIWPNRSPQAAVLGVTENTACGELHQRIRSNESDGGKRSSKKDKKEAGASVINVDLLSEVTEPPCCSAPTLFQQEGKLHFTQMTLPVDCVVSAQVEDTVGSVCTRLVEALCTQLADMEEVVLQHRSGTSLPVPQPFHFLLPGPVGLVTVVYPAGVPDARLEPLRKARLCHKTSMFLTRGWSGLQPCCSNTTVELPWCLNNTVSVCSYQAGVPTLSTYIQNRVEVGEVLLSVERRFID